jgi:hypothetical protein
MKRLLADNFKANRGAKLAITVAQVKRLTPDVMLSRGLATVTLRNSHELYNPLKGASACRR